MAKQRPAWVKDVKVFGWFTLLNGVLVFVGIFGTIQCGWGQFGVAWLWVFSFPCSLAGALGLRVDQWVAWTLVCLSTLLYGLMWWGIWKAVKLFRAKPAD